MPPASDSAVFPLTRSPGLAGRRTAARSGPCRQWHVQWSTELPQVVLFQTNPPGTAALDLSSVAERISKAGLQMTVETDCLAGHVDGVSGLVAAVSGPLGGCASD
jgi:hypothetical protein